ncbi:MAG: polysaccharide biosynthesis/export family protein [Campylobacterota bacterium]|nr:polysaccharide biosynthesis/export family protein [Campylobacterota bacterium]
MLFSGCSTKNDRLFQNKNSNGIKDTKSIVTQEQYKNEMTFEYKIAANDRLSIMVYIQSGAGSQQMNSILASKGINTDIENQENVGLLVTQDGTVRLPLLGSIKVTGLTQDEASKLLIDEYKKFIRNPYVTVEIMNQRIIVVGEVKRPGIVPIVNGTMSLVEVISRSGDMTDLAERTNIKIIRGDLRSPEVRIIDLTKLDILEVSSLLLKPNDIVYVQPRNMKGYNKVFAEIAPFFNMASSVLNPVVQYKTLIGSTLD